MLRDHPRICGEHSLDHTVKPCVWGSSPHMRGTHLGLEHETVRPGIIPAYAGNTRWYWQYVCCGGDHPRICGEHAPFLVEKVFRWGSSPHMRGTPIHESRSSEMSGIIPAYAGNTPTASSPARPTWDHPRICGEHASRPVLPRGARGSSPHMRGTRFRRSLRRGPAGIIPAYAGNTLRDYYNFVVSKFMSFVFHLV